jgi:hypothetical protein
MRFDYNDPHRLPSQFDSPSRDTPSSIVILSEAKDLLSCQRTRQRILRFAQDDKGLEIGNS